MIGIITQRHSELYMVDICGPCPAFLPALAFEGVARRNRPNLQVRVPGLGEGGGVWGFGGWEGGWVGGGWRGSGEGVWGEGEREWEGGGDAEWEEGRGRGKEMNGRA